jgi:hypothetical protein
MATELEQQSNNTSHKEAVSRQEELLKYLRDHRRGSLPRQAFADLAEIRYADNVEMARRGCELVQQRIRVWRFNHFDPTMQIAMSYNDAYKRVEYLVEKFRTNFYIAHPSNNSDRVRADFQQRFIEILNNEITDEDHPDSTLANQAANGTPWLKRSRTSRGNCMHSASGVDFTKYRARQRC